MPEPSPSLREQIAVAVDAIQMPAAPSYVADAVLAVTEPDKARAVERAYERGRTKGSVVVTQRRDEKIMVAERERIRAAIEAIPAHHLNGNGRYGFEVKRDVLAVFDKEENPDA